MAKTPRIVRADGRPWLLILGLQWACKSCFSVEEMDRVFDHAARLSCNRAVLPTHMKARDG